MTKKIIYLTFLGLQFHPYISAQEYSVKGRISSEVYAHPAAGTWFYHIDGAYGLARQFDVGINLGTSFSPGIDNYLINLDARYYFTPLLFKNANNVDLYLKGSIGYHRTRSENLSSGGFTYAGYLGIRYFPFKRVGIMAEGGIDSFGFTLKTNFGLCFKLKL